MLHTGKPWRLRLALRILKIPRRLINRAALDGRLEIEGNTLTLWGQTNPNDVSYWVHFTYGKDREWMG